MSAAFGLSCCSFTLVLESMLSHNPVKPTTVSYRNLAIIVAKTTRFALKNRYRNAF